MPPVALTRGVPKSLARCELTHVSRQPIDLAVAEEQHRCYEALLAELGCEIVRLPSLDDHADSVFVEDTAVVLEDVALITRPGAESRRGETSSVAAALSRYRPLLHLEPPATLDGGDVLRIGRTLYVGVSSRTNPAGVAQLRDVAGEGGYGVVAVEVTGCLHLKSAVTRLPGDAVLLNPRWVDAARFCGAEAIEVDPAEEYAANVLAIGSEVICAAAFPRTRERLARRGYQTRAVDVSELAKAEGALTCCSILVE